MTLISGWCMTDYHEGCPKDFIASDDYPLSPGGRCPCPCHGDNPTPSSGRANCPDCGKDIFVRADGKVRGHKISGEQCPGSFQDPVFS